MDRLVVGAGCDDSGWPPTLAVAATELVMAWPTRRLNYTGCPVVAGTRRIAFLRTRGSN